MPDPQLEKEKRFERKKKPPATDINLMHAGIKAIGIGLAFVLCGQWATFGADMYWPFGVALTVMGASFPPVYLWIMIRLARQMEQPAPPQRIPN